MLNRCPSAAALNMCGSAVMGPLSCCCTASGTPATCGSLRRQGVTDHVALAEILVKDHRVIIPDLRGMGCPHIRRAVTKRLPRPAISQQSSTS